MSEYVAPLPDIKFVLDHIAGIDGLSKLNGYQHAERDVVFSILDEGARFVQDLVAPLNQVGDVEGSTISGSEVTTPPGFKEAYRAYVEAGWGGIDFPAEWGGHEMPKVVGMAFEEMLTAANFAFSLCPLLTFGAIDALVAHGTDEQKATYLPKLISGEWSATMNLTESHAGSDVGALTTRAKRLEDGAYAIIGTKIFITYGEHDLTDNVIHLVLGRTSDAPSGTSGISMFIVPKYLPVGDGTVGRRNDLKVVSLEHKLGIKASPTCVMSYGEDEGGAIGWILGEENQGMRNMFTMMNSARISVGLEGMATAERAYQQAAIYALERRQGQAIGAEDDSLIVDHPDVRRMLLTMRANVEAMRALLYRTAMHEDHAVHAESEDERIWHGHCVALLTPVVKTWCTDLGVQMTSVGVQVHGGMGFIEETGAAQHFRDARVTPIYEGTNGIQSIDLVMRKLPLEGGKAVGHLIGQMDEAAERLATAGHMSEAEALTDAVSALRSATDWLLEQRDEPNELLAGATPYCTMFGIVAGGWMMAESTLAAPENADKATTARFYLHQIVPTARGLLQSVTAGSSDLFAIDAADL